MLQGGFVEVRFHELARSVFGKVSPPVLAWHGNEFTSGAADADGENLDTVLRCLFRGGDAFPAKVFTVRDEDQDLFGRASRLEDSHGLSDGRGNVGAAARDHFRVESVQRFAEGIVIKCHRALQKGIARKGNQPHAVPI